METIINRMHGTSEQLIDEILVMDCQSGRAKALELLVRRWQKRLWHHAYRLVGDSEAAWDVTQQSWVGIIKGLRKLRDPARFRAWAYRITTNQAVDWIKNDSSTQHFDIDEIPDPPGGETKEFGLKELLERLDVKRRAVLSLYYLEELSVAEVGIALNIPEGTVKSRLASARKELKALWKRHSEQG